MKLRLPFLTAALSLYVVVGVWALPTSAADVNGSFERTLTVSGPVELDIVTGSGDVIVRKGESGSVRVKGIIQVSGNQDIAGSIRDLELHPPIQQDGNHILIGPVEGKGAGWPASIDYEIVAPAETRLTVKGGSSDLSIEGVRGPVKATTGSGDIRLDSIEDGIEAHTGSGDIRMRPTGGGKIEVETGSGDVVLHLPSQGGFDLSAHTRTGELSVGSHLSLAGKVTDTEVVGKLRGGGQPIGVRTESGDIRID
jgi:hypothetical protein